MNARTTSIAVTLVALACAIPARVEAGCGGGGGGGGGGGSGGSGCRERSPVVGFQSCGRYGQWDTARRSPLILGAGLVLRTQPLGAGMLSGSAEHDGANHGFSMDAGALPSLHLAGFSIRPGVLIARRLYLGGELETTLGATPGGTRRQGDQVLTPTSVISVGALAVAGLWTPLAAGRLRLRAEVALGGRAVSINFRSVLGDCDGAGSVMASQWVVEPRLGAEYFVSPWTSIGIEGGMNVLNPGQVTAAVSLRWHPRAFDGVLD